MLPYYKKRIELHNHTLESDGAMTAIELADFLRVHGITAYALTDHNTISGLDKTKQYLATGVPMELVCGYELTSYMGHILCHNIPEYIHWEDIRMDNADMLFDRVHSMGGIVGIAHPFSAVFPISNGMRFAMKIHDLNKLDFVEIVNHAHPYVPDNKQALEYWESLYLQGYSVSPASGLDLHRPDTDLTNAYTTWLLLPDSLKDHPISEQLHYAIKHQHICVSNGPVLHSCMTADKLSVFIENETLPGASYELVLRTPQGNYRFPVTDVLDLDVALLSIDPSAPVIAELYEQNRSQEQPCAIAPVIYS